MKYCGPLSVNIMWCAEESIACISHITASTISLNIKLGYGSEKNWNGYIWYP